MHRDLPWTALIQIVRLLRAPDFASNRQHTDKHTERNFLLIVYYLVSPASGHLITSGPQIKQIFLE